MQIQSFPTGPFDTNAYVLSCERTKHSAIIDPGPESFELIRRYVEQKQLIPTKILLTHSHWDHLVDVPVCKRHFGIPIFVHDLDRGNLENPGSDGLPCWIKREGVKADGTFKEGDKIDIGNLMLTVIETPGHTPGGVCFYIPSQKTLISGDTLFRGTIGNLSFPGCNSEAMWVSLSKLAKLPTDTKVYPGHGPSTTIGAENWLPRAKELFG